MDTLTQQDREQLKRVVDTGQEFYRKAVDAGAARDGLTTIVSLAMGVFREVMRCPNCPDTFRVPLNKEETVIGCPKCKHTWRYVGS